MGKGFTLEINPCVYVAKFTQQNRWEETYTEKPHLSKSEEDNLPDSEREAIFQKRNSFPELPLVNYTTQYGFGCFEGLKAFPQKDGGLKLFRPDENGMRMESSMKGLLMPVYPYTKFVEAVKKVVANNKELGFAPTYDAVWEKDDYQSGHAIYLRPFSYTEAGIGLNLSKNPYVIIVSTAVGAYFDPGNPKAVTTKLIRAFPGGTGWIKCDANYVNSTLAKMKAMADGYMEAVFLDSKEQKYFEEGSSCNIFFLLKSGTLVTPSLGDTVLPGVTRKSVIQIAKDKGIKVEERKISVEEVFSEGNEVFVTGTASGVVYLNSLTHNGKMVTFNKGEMGETTHYFLKTLKGIQYGALPDPHGWMVDVGHL